MDGSFFCNFFFVGEPGWEDEPDQPRKFFELSTPLLSSPLRVLTWNNLRLPGWDETGLPGWDNTKLPGWDEMGWGEMWMTSQDEMMAKDSRKMILYMKIMGQQCCDGHLLRKYQIHQQLKILLMGAG